MLASLGSLFACTWRTFFVCYITYNPQIRQEWQLQELFISLFFITIFIIVIIYLFVCFFYDEGLSLVFDLGPPIIHACPLSSEACPSVCNVMFQTPFIPKGTFGGRQPLLKVYYLNILLFHLACFVFINFIKSITFAFIYTLS